MLMLRSPISRVGLHRSASPALAGHFRHVRHGNLGGSANRQRTRGCASDLHATLAGLLSAGRRACRGRSIHHGPHSGRRRQVLHMSRRRHPAPEIVCIPASSTLASQSRHGSASTTAQLCESGRILVVDHSECFFRPTARFVAARTVRLGIGLGTVTAILLALASGSLPRVFTPDSSVLAAVALIFPW